MPSWKKLIVSGSDASLSSLTTTGKLQLNSSETGSTIFEVNGVKPSEVLQSTKKTYPTPKELKNPKQIYAVQFGVFMQVQPYATLKRLDDVWYETTEHGTYVYLSGEFTSPDDATVHKNTLVKLGYPNAFVVQLAK